MKTEDLIDAYMEVNQDEEIYQRDVYAMYVGEDEDLNPSDATNAERWAMIRVMSPEDLDLEDLNWIRRIMHEKSGRGTGYGVRKYKYPDYFSGLSVWIPDGWAIEDYLSRQYWEGESVLALKTERQVAITKEEIERIYRRLGASMTWLSLMGLIGWAIQPFFAKGNEDSLEPRDKSQSIFDYIYEPIDTSYYVRDANQEWRTVIIQLTEWNANDMVYYAEEILNKLPWFNRVDEVIQTFINIPWDIWENLSFENTVPNEVIYANWDKCVRDLDNYFNLLGEQSENEGYIPYGDDVASAPPVIPSTSYYSNVPQGRYEF